MLIQPKHIVILEIQSQKHFMLIGFELVFFLLSWLFMLTNNYCSIFSTYKISKKMNKSLESIKLKI